MQRGKMTIRIIEDWKVWDSLVDESPYGLIFHKSDFLKIVEKHSGHILIPYGIYRGDDLICVFPIYYRKYKGIKMAFSPPPSMGIPYMGFVMGKAYDSLAQHMKEAYVSLVANDFDREMKKLSPNYMYIKLGPKFSDARPFKWNRYKVDTFFTYMHDLNKPVDTIWNEFDKDCRKKIREAEKPTLRIKESRDVEIFYEIMKKRFDGTEETSYYNTIGPEYLKEIVGKFPKNIRIYNLCDGDDIIGVTINCEYKGRTTGWMGCAKGHCNEYMLWEVIKNAKKEGLVEMENIDATTERLTLFKSKFNPTLEIGFHISKKDVVGTIAEWAFNNVIKKTS